MTTPFTGPLVPADNFKITVPDDSYVNEAGEVVINMSGNPGGPIAATTLSASGAVQFDDDLNVDGATTTHALAATGAISATTTVTAGTELVATTTVTAGTGVTATTGNITASAGNLVASLGDVVVSAGDITATLGTVQAPAVVATTSLTLTGATINGMEVAFPLVISDLRALSAKTYRVASPFAGTITRILSNLNDALAAGDAVLTPNIAAVAMTDGAITIPQAATPGDVVSVNPSAANVVVQGSDINVAVTGANTANVAATLTFILRRSA